MKKKYQSYGVLLALSCCTLAYAATSTGARTLLKQIDSSVKQFISSNDDSKKSAHRTLSLTPEQMAMLRQQVHQQSTMRRIAADSLQSDSTKRISEVLWDSQSDTYNVANVSNKECELSGTTVSFMGNQQGNLILSAITGEGGYGWSSKIGYTYHMETTLTAEGTTEVMPCIVYTNDNGNNLYILTSNYVLLDSTNNYTAKVNIAAPMMYDNAIMFVAYCTYDNADYPDQVKITATDNKFYAEGAVETNVKPWTADSTMAGLGLSDDVYGDKYVYTCDDSLTTLGLVRSGNGLYITGINTTATSFTLPYYAQIDGQNLPIVRLGYGKQVDWSAAQSLTTLIFGKVTNIAADFSSSAITDLVSYYTDISLDCSGTENIYLHLPYGAERNNYYGFKRVLIGEETPEYPETSNSSYVMKGNAEGEYFGISLIDNYLSVTEIFTDKESIRLPLAARWNNGNFYINRLGNDGYYSSALTAHAPNLKTLYVPERYWKFHVYWNYGSIREFHMEGTVTENYWGMPSDTKVYVANQDLYDYYASQDSWRNANIIPEGWDFDWYTVNVGRKGEFAQTYIEMTDANWDLARNVKVTGALNEGDLKNIKNLTNLRKLDLSEATFSTLPNDFLRDKTKLTEVSLPATVSDIPQYAFNGCSNLTKVAATGIKSIQYSAFGDCKVLTDLDISNATSIASYAFRDCNKFCPAQLSADLTKLESYAFSNTAIKEVTIPNGITNINPYVFSGCKNLIKVVLPENLQTISSNVFADCTNLTDIQLPEGLTTIANSAFSNCQSLPELIIPESVTSIEMYAFRNCKKFTEIIIPSNVQSVGGGIVSGCDSIKTIKCKAVVPPTSNYDLTSGIDLNHVSLYVAPFAIDAYRDAEGWNGFYIIKALAEPVKNIFINRPMTFDLQSQDNAVLQNNPNMTLAYAFDRWGNCKVGQLTASGDGTLSAGVFDINHYINSRGNYNYDYRVSLVNNAENMRADSVACTMTLQKDTWHFISFQYDVQMADVFGLNNTDFVIRQYNGEKRALGSDSETSTSNWEDVAADGILKAGKGYIIQAANNSTDSLGNYYEAVVVFPSRNTITKNKLFASTNVIVPLDEYPAEFAHNRSWNLVGNPYPCYYDMHSLQDDFSSPIVLWRGSSYQAYSPIDDDVILRPNEAFFVQRPINKEEMVFAVDGRMHYTDAMSSNNGTPGAKAPALTIAQTNRSVFNFNVEGNGTDDRARIVMNDKATMGYDINTDAAKFFAETSKGVEVYVTADTKYDICERPFADGSAKLGIRTATAGTYTIALTGKNISGWTVLLTDTETGQTVDITAGAYQFEAKGGDAPARFVLTFKRTETTGISNAPVSEAAQSVSITTVDGKKIFEGSISDFKASATAGVYVVKDADKAYKIVVK